MLTSGRKMWTSEVAKADPGGRDPVQEGVLRWANHQQVACQQLCRWSLAPSDPS